MKKEAEKVLILGGAGYIGAVLSPYLMEKGYDIKVIDACWFGNYLPEEVPIEKKDILDLDIAAFEGYDTVIFLAGLSNDPMAEFSPRANFIYNTGMPAYVGFMAREAGVKRLIFASSCSVYGYTHNSTFTESDPAVSNYPYGVSKLQGEQTLLALADENFSVICFRQGTVCGYSPRMRLDLAINTMFKNALSLNEIQLSNAKIWRPVLGLSDLCSAYESAVRCSLEGGHIINLSSFNTTIGELARELATYMQVFHGKNISISDKKLQDYRNYKVSTEKATELLDYKPVQTAMDIFQDLSSHLNRFADFDNEHYYNIQMFQKRSNPEQVHLMNEL